MSDKLYTRADLRDAFTEGVADTISANAGRFNGRPLTPDNPYLRGKAVETIKRDPAAVEECAQKLWDHHLDHEGLSISYEEAVVLVLDTYAGIEGQNNGS